MANSQVIRYGPQVVDLWSIGTHHTLHIGEWSPRALFGQTLIMVVPFLILSSRKTDREHDIASAEAGDVLSNTEGHQCTYLALL